MTTNETTTLRAIRSQVLYLAERLAGVNIGVPPITKADAASDLYRIARNIRAIAGDSWGDKGEDY